MTDPEVARLLPPNEYEQLLEAQRAHSRWGLSLGRAMFSSDFTPKEKRAFVSGYCVVNDGERCCHCCIGAGVVNCGVYPNYYLRVCPQCTLEHTTTCYICGRPIWFSRERRAHDRV